MLDQKQNAAFFLFIRDIPKTTQWRRVERKQWANVYKANLNKTKQELQSQDQKRWYLVHKTFHGREKCILQL